MAWVLAVMLFLFVWKEETQPTTYKYNWLFVRDHVYDA